MYRHLIAALALLIASACPLQAVKPTQYEAFNTAIHNSIAQLMHWGKQKNDSLARFISPTNIDTVISLLRNCVSLWEQQRKAIQSINYKPLPKINSGIARCSFPNNNLLFLPGLTGGSLKVPGVYHLYSQAEIPVQYRLSCNFHALYNIVKMERIFCRSSIDDRTFLQICQSVAPDDLHKSSTTTQGATIAYELGLNNVYYLGNKKGRIYPFFDTDYEYRIREGETKKEAEQRAIRERENNLWANIRSEFGQKSGPCCFHFVCHIQSRSIRQPGRGEKHFFLTSVVKTADNKVACYIADNVNEDENHQSQAEMRNYVEHIYHQLAYR